MNINRYNYEEFFLLYVDNELTKAERLEVEAFVDTNPDLQEELAMLNGLKLKPEAGVRFEAKELLMKPEASAGMINATNYEEFFLLYVDNELNAVERREVEGFAANNPAMRQELNLLLQTKAEPEHAIVFPDKSLLYKQPETDRKPVVIIWRRIAAVAAMLLVALGIFWITNRGTTIPAEVAIVDDTQQGSKQNAPVANENSSQSNNDQQVQQPINVQDQQLATKEENKSTHQANKPLRRLEEPEQKDKQELATIDNRQTPLVETERPLTRTGIATISDNTSGTDISTRVESAHLTPAAQVNEQPILVSYASNTMAEDNYGDEAFGPVSVKKNKLRGLFRKVTRVFEKTTNLPSVEEKGILIGSFEIALK